MAIVGHSSSAYSIPGQGEERCFGDVKFGQFLPSANDVTGDLAIEQVRLIPPRGFNELNRPALRLRTSRRCCCSCYCCCIGADLLLLQTPRGPRGPSLTAAVAAPPHSHTNSQHKLIIPTVWWRTSRQLKCFMYCDSHIMFINYSIMYFNAYTI